MAFTVFSLLLCFLIKKVNSFAGMLCVSLILCIFAIRFPMRREWHFILKNDEVGTFYLDRFDDDLHLGDKGAIRSRV